MSVDIAGGNDEFNFDKCGVVNRDCAICICACCRFSQQSATKKNAVWESAVRRTFMVSLVVALLLVYYFLSTTA
ncbi:TPA: hypothetical protein ACQFK2_002504 [Proteus mirabilis]